MQSIAKLAPGSQGYYLEQADGRVGHVRGVATGVEDYYLGGPEAAGRWIGAVARRLGLDGSEVAEELLDRALGARDPATGELLDGPVTRRKVPGFDLTFSVPKSASVLWALGDDRVRAAVWRAQRVAVADGLRYMEAEAGWGRFGAGGMGGWFQGDGLLGAAFEHRTSRAGDPHIHTHVLVANQVRRPDGTFSTLDSRRVYREAKTAGFIHEAAFRHELTRELGVAWTVPVKGTGEIEGVSPQVRRAFSRRRREIEAYTRVRGQTSRAARQVAAYRTRQAKDYEVTPALLASEWRARAGRLGLDHEAVMQLLGAPPPGTGAAAPRARVAGRARRALRPAHRDSARGRERSSRRPPGHDHRDGRPDARQPAGGAAAGPEHPARADDPAPRRPLGERRRVPAAVLDPGHAGHRTPAPRRRRRGPRPRCRPGPPGPCRGGARRPPDTRLRSGGDGSTALQRRRPGPAGDRQSGLGQDPRPAGPVEAWAHSGRPVAGAAVSRQAARNLERHAHMPATTIAALLHGTAEIPRRGVLVVDEAGMLPTRDLHQLLVTASERETKLVLVGDARQLPEIEAGGAFAALARRLQAIELTHDRRQQDPQRRALLDELCDGDVTTALAALHHAGELRFTRTNDEAFDTLVTGYLAALEDGQDALMLALRRNEVAELNHRARDALTRTGKLGPVELQIDGVELAVGDRVLLRVNDSRLDAQNGARGTIRHIDRCTRSVDVNTGTRTIRLDQHYLNRAARDGGPPIAHGYAATAHAAQGATVDQAFVLAGDAIYREWLYVALSRARENTTVIAPEMGPTKDEQLQRLVELAARTRAQTMALDHAPAIDTATLLAHRIGPRPAQPAAALAWDRALEAVDRYRHAQTITEQHTLLGDPPREATARLHWTLASRLIDRADPARARDLENEL